MRKLLLLSLVAIVSIGCYILFNTSSELGRQTEEIVQSGSAKYFAEKRARKLAGDYKKEAPEMIGIINKALRTPVDLESPNYEPNYLVDALKNSEKRKQNKNKNEVFTERGPGNVAGRTRAVVVYKGDKNRTTWLAGSASGGIWKTTDAGQSWTHKTQELPNLGTNTLANSNAASDIVFAGTGEHFTADIDGAGIFKSSDFGETWEQVGDPNEYPDMRNVSRIIMDPNNADVVIATTRNSVWTDSLQAAIYKTTDGGDSWRRVLSSFEDRYDDIDFNPENFNTQFVAINGIGVLKSTDAGETWFNSSAGMIPFGRVEISTSRVDTNYIWASVQGAESGTSSDLYLSRNAGATWDLALNEDGGNENFLTGQGWYDNTIMAHPYNKNIVYVGGVNLWKFVLDGTSFSKTTLSLDRGDTQDFLSFVNGNSIGGGIDFGNVAEADRLPIEIRFGQGTQKAHRFTVDMQGPGVPVANYTYQNYVDIPFQVWDMKNDTQLMVSFRDQQGDGVWTLKNIDTQAPHDNDSREYIFVHNRPYNEEADPQFAINGGHDQEQLYFMWPFLIDGAFADAANFPQSTLAIDEVTTKGLGRVANTISDAYFEFEGLNSFSNEQFENNEGVHPDQHGIFALLQGDDNFQILATNDGGLYLTNAGKDPGTTEGDFNYAGYGYNTSQFYGADKAPNEDRYIGGMQDNSTWFTPKSEAPANGSSAYQFAVGGDGFEALWNNRDPQQLLGSIQFNTFQKSKDGGETWGDATSGIDDNGPFISRLANSKGLPDRVFTVGSSGVWVSNDFGESWNSTPINDMWGGASPDVQVSIADYNVVWAGGALTEDTRLFISEDGGTSFEPTEYYQEEELGSVSGIATHPTDRATAYAMFSFGARPKILKTTNLGKSWVDISGFDKSENGISTKGFPDVAVNTLFVFPNDTQRIWAGTEIGIVESLDGGESWAILETAMGAANAYDFILQDDQLVIATYGRGIWTATIEGITQSYVFAPFIRAASTAPNGDIGILASLFEEYDSTQIFLNGTLVGTIGSNSVGDSSLILNEEIINGVNLIEFKSYLDSITYPSNIYSFEGVRYGAAVSEYVTDFTDEFAVDDFFGNGYSIRIEDQFDNPAIHSIHPYTNNQEFILSFNRPVNIVANQTLSYNDVAIIETGEPGSVFGTLDFYDYVVLEASIDGNIWEPLEPGYDANYNPNWLSVYNAGGEGSSELYVNHEFSLPEIFEAGAVIFLRFRMNTDPGATGWGWAIDDFKIEVERTTPTIEIENTELNVYPNPATDRIWVDLDRSLNYQTLELSTINGQVLNQWSISNLDQLEIEISEYSSGMYFLTFRNSKDQSVQRLVIE